MKIGIILKLKLFLNTMVLVCYNYIDNSPQKIITSIFPEYEWIPWKFFQVPRNYWKNMKM